MAHLRLIAIYEPRERIDLNDRITIGRAEDADVVVDDPGASRMHAAISRTSDGYFIEDLGSKNGTLVNGRPVVKALLDEGDQIQIGSRIWRLVTGGPKSIAQE